jgi:ribosomal protein L37E
MITSFTLVSSQPALSLRSQSCYNFSKCHLNAYYSKHNIDNKSHIRCNCCGTILYNTESPHASVGFLIFKVRINGCLILCRFISQRVVVRCNKHSLQHKFPSYYGLSIITDLLHIHIWTFDTICYNKKIQLHN